MAYRRAIWCYQSVTGKILTIPNRPPDEFIAAEFCLNADYFIFFTFLHGLESFLSLKQNRFHILANIGKSYFIEFA
jgi:hypothetical protein